MPNFQVPDIPLHPAQLSTMSSQKVEDVEAQTSDGSTTSEVPIVRTQILEKAGLVVKIEEEVPIVVTHVMPEEKHRRWYQIRHIVFTTYRRLFCIIVIANIFGWGLLHFHHYDLEYYLRYISTFASANLFLALSMRQDYIVNALLELAVWSGPYLPLRIRCTIAKVYEFGGVHSGSAICSVGWFIRLAVLLTEEFIRNNLINIPSLVLTYVLLLLFLSIVIFAHPSARRRAHDAFERSHRFSGWTSNILFWTLIVLVADELSYRAGEERTRTQILLTLPSFYLLTINTIHTVLPWLRLRKLSATPEALSAHALRLHLKGNIGAFYTIRISDKPLSEWHSFACFEEGASSSRNGSTNSVVISRAGDWTSQTIAEPKPYYWTRGRPTRGALYCSLMFRKVVVITTGSGIGPCLNLLAMNPLTRPEIRVFWSTPMPVETFGQEIVDVVLDSDPDAVIWDTKKHGRPDMAALTWHMMVETGAEAAFVISNPKVTKDVVYKLRARGLPAYGPIFDS